MLNVPGCGPTHKIHTLMQTHTDMYTEQLKITFFRRILVKNIKEEKMNLLRKNIWNSCNNSYFKKEVSDLLLCNFCKEFFKKCKG